MRWDIAFVLIFYMAASIGLIWWLIRWSRNNKRSTRRWCIAGLCFVAYVGQWLYVVIASVPSYPPAHRLLNLSRAELTRQGAEPRIGLGGNGPYSGCNVLLLEHFVFNCFSLRTSIEGGLSAETIRDAVQAACMSIDCPYQGWFRLSIVYMDAPKVYQKPDGGVITKREQLETYRFTLYGGKK